MLGSTLLSVERVVFDWQAGLGMALSLGFGGSAPFTSQVGTGLSAMAELVGGAGTDTLVPVAKPSADGSTFTAPNFTYTNWSTPTRPYLPGDRVYLGNLSTFSTTLVAAEHIAGVMHLSGGTGNETLTGSSGMDFLGSGGGVDVLHGGDGNDVLALTNNSTIINGPNGTVQLVLLESLQTGAGSLFDGGAGFDILSIGGVVNFQGTLVHMEGVNLVPGFTPPVANTTKQDAAVLDIDSAHLAMLPVDTFFRGTGTVIVEVSNHTGFDGSHYTFDGASNIKFTINGEDGNGLVYRGTSGVDYFDMGQGDQTVTGGAGADVFNPAPGHGVVTDFTHGVDKIDLHGPGFSSFNQLLPYMSEVNGSATFTLLYGGVVSTFTLQGVPLATLTASDFIFADPNGTSFNSGTESADTMFGLGGNDTLLGLGGNDIIYSGGGSDSIDGGAGNDTIVLTGPLGNGSNLNGGADSDTLELTPAAINLVLPQGSYVNTTVGTVTGFETIKFDSVANDHLLAIMGMWQIVPGSTVQGGAGVDGLIVVLPSAGVYTVPSLNFVNWSNSDFVIVTAGNQTGNFTLNSNDHVGVWSLSGATGNDVLNGSDGIEIMTGAAGNDTINGGRGIDTANYSGNRADYSLHTNGNGTLTITDLRGGSPDGTDTLSGIERLNFADGAVRLPTGNDFNNDGVGDLLFTASGGLLADWLLGGPTTLRSGGGGVGNSGSGYRVVGLADYSGDGTTDILFRAPDGSLLAWGMRDNAINGTASLGNPGAQLAVVGSGDFNGDGQADVLFVNALTGAYSSWDIGINGAVIGGGTIGAPGAQWSLAAIGDYNGDGKSDLMFRNTNGTFADWTLDNASITGGGSLGYPGTAFSLATGHGANSFASLMFQRTDGLVAGWEVNQATQVGFGVLGNPGPGWTAKATGDFSANGEHDVLFQYTDGTLALWQSDGTPMLGGAGVSNAGSYAFAATGDINGDGKSDLVFKNASGDYVAWLMDNTAIVSTGLIANAPTEWHLI